MARISLFVLLASMALAGINSVLAADEAAVPLANTVDHVADIDDEGQPMRYYNSVVGDDDDDDYSEEELKQRSLLRRSKHHHKSSRKSKGNEHFTVGSAIGDVLWNKNIQITWYASHDLLNPQCGNGGGKWQPENSCHIGAVMVGWSGGPKCGEFVNLCNKKAKNHCVRVRVIDKCAGCGPGHVDLTKSAFKKLSPSGSLTEGRLHGLQMYRTKIPNPWDLALFGPRKL